MSEKAWIGPRSDRSHDSGAAALAARGLPPELLRETWRRLELLAYSVGVTFLAAMALNTAADGSFELAGAAGRRHAVAVAMILVSAAVAWLARGGLPAARLLDVGLVYQVIVAAGISIGDHQAPLASTRPLEQISWLCVWIVMLPVIVPARPARTLLVGLVSASTWPAVLLLGVALGRPWPGTRMGVLSALPGYLAAALALVPTVIIRKLANDVARARAMGSYELVERLAFGGMGEVWRARHRMLARPAAIKLIRPEALGGSASSESLLLRFEQEAQATARLHSPHTIELYDFGVTPDGTFYYVMELLCGVDLEQLVRRFGPLPAERAIHFLLQACDSLEDAHHAGLVHRDVKPANLFACRMGPRLDVLKVLDFGLVKADWEGDVRLTSDGVAAGTPAYMAPEVALGKPVDARADLYALGCVGYWLVTGQVVFEGTTPTQVALQHATALPVPPSQRAELPIPPALEQVILACLEKDPARRPQDAAQLAGELRACTAVPPWSPERARIWWDVHLPLQP